jgi:alkylation response protein AidB-like acyl-CoA dehydrogenase
VARPAAGDDGAPGWRVSGRKIFSTGAPGLQWLLVWGATSPDAPGGQRAGWLVVPGGSPGIRIEETWDPLGMRATGSHDVVLEDVWIPFEHAVGLQQPGEARRGRDVVLIGWLTTLFLSVYRGAAQAARDWLVRYLGERVPSNLGAPLASLPRMQEAVGEIDARLYTADCVLGALAADLDRGGADAARAAEEQGIAKVAVTRALIESVSIAIGLIGNAGLTHHHPLQRHYRDVLCCRIHTPQDDAALLAAGRAALLP